MVVASWEDSHQPSRSTFILILSDWISANQYSESKTTETQIHFRKVYFRLSPPSTSMIPFLVFNPRYSLVFTIWGLKTSKKIRDKLCGLYGKKLYFTNLQSFIFYFQSPGVSVNGVTKRARYDLPLLHLLSYLGYVFGLENRELEGDPINNNLFFL